MDFSKLSSQLVKHTLEFKFLAKTSRDELRTKDTWFLSLTDKAGVTGIGECSIIPGLSTEKPEAFEKKLNHVAENFSEYQNYHESLVKFPAIRFGIETALLDLKTGGKRHLFPTDFTLKKKPMPINGLVWMGDKAFMSKQVKEKIEAGFSCIKLKIGALDFEQELEILKSIRSEYSAKDIEIRVDANGAFSLDDALEKLFRLSDYDLHSIEQPIKQGQPDEMAALCQFSAIDIALDEELIGVHSLAKKKALLEIIQPQYIILKPSLLGGFKACEEWISIAKSSGINYWNTSALEANIGLNAISQWTSSLNNPLPQGLGTGGLYHNNIPSPLTVSNGEIFYDGDLGWDLSVLK
ncbi:MAG: o-succinylbenzoate synthase [Flavobacteriales bacterium]